MESQLKPVGEKLVIERIEENKTASGLVTEAKEEIPPTSMGRVKFSDEKNGIKKGELVLFWTHEASKFMIKEDNDIFRKPRFIIPLSAVIGIVEEE
jgi:co-chaperonin GroES (HSP10)